MTVKERLHQIIEDLPEELPETAIGVAENALQPYQNTIVPANGQRTETREVARLTGDERRAEVRALFGSCRGARPGIEDFLREKREETEREERQWGSSG